MVSGFRWCPYEPQKMRIETLVRNILCEKHNKDLSEVDANAKLAMATLCKSFRLWEARKNLLSRSWKVFHFSIDMLLLERWCVKTLIDIHFEGGYRFAPQSETGSPTPDLIEIAFGRRRFRGNAGLHLIAKVGQVVNMEEGRVVIAALADGEHLTGAEFTLWGLPFLLNLLPTPVPSLNGNHLMKQNIEHWFKTRDDKGRMVNSHLVKFVYGP
jgi:hypothetical protein